MAKKKVSPSQEQLDDVADRVEALGKRMFGLGDVTRLTAIQFTAASNVFAAASLHHISRGLTK